MEELTEKRVWQRVRGEHDSTERVRAILADQGPVLGTYRAMSRRGGAWRRLWELKEEQVACLRGLLRVLTGQSAARPRPGGCGDLSACLAAERRLLGELTELSRDAQAGDLVGLLTEGQRRICRLCLELMGSS